MFSFLPYRRLYQTFLLYLILGPKIASAQSPLRDLVKKPLLEVAEKALLIKRGATVGSPLDLVGLALYLMLAFVGVIFVVQVVLGGYMWMTAGGNEEQIKKAQGKISNGAIGAAIIFFAYIITAFVLYMITTWGGIPFDAAAP